jgi:hypothetical protein
MWCASSSSSQQYPSPIINIDNSRAIWKKKRMDFDQATMNGSGECAKTVESGGKWQAKKELQAK